MIFKEKSSEVREEAKKNKTKTYGIRRVRDTWLSVVGKLETSKASRIPRKVWRQTVKMAVYYRS